jgi:beta-lactamase superfamily II metal-dependent hydrolase
MSVFSLAMHPASEGDALELIWGATGAQHRALIDLGRENDYRKLRAGGVASGPLELFVITHVDADHIAGAIPMVAEASAPFAPKEVWFNAYHHLANARRRLDGDSYREPLSVEQGEKLSNGILNFRWPWNCRFGCNMVSVDSIEATRPVEFKGLLVTLLSPTDAGLASLQPAWKRFLKGAGLLPEDKGEAPLSPIEDDRERLSGSLDVDVLAAAQFVEDSAKPNGTSIAFLAEFEGKRVLFGADAHPNVLENSLRRFGYSEQNPLRLDLYKVAHHGSKANTSKSLLRILDCTRFAFSTDGTRNNHPNPETIARILVNDPNRAKTLYFNFRQKNATNWDVPELKSRWNYDCAFPPGQKAGLTIRI